MLLLVLGLAGAVAFSFGEAALVHYLAETPVMPVAALASIALAAVAAAVHWRRAVPAPHAFPAGRFA